MCIVSTWQSIEILLGQNQMACGACQCALTRTETIKVDAVINNHVQQWITDLSLCFYLFAVGFVECHLNPGNT